MDSLLVKRVNHEEEVAIKKWGSHDRTPDDLGMAALEELGEVAHAINHNKTIEEITQEIVETIGVLSRLYDMVIKGYARKP